MKKKAKVRGIVLLEAFLALLLMAMASYGLVSVNSVQFSQMAAGRESDLAKNYAELEAEYLKSLGYDAVVTKNKDEDDTSRPPRYPKGQQSSVDKASNARNMTKFLGATLGAEWRSTATLGTTINNINGDSGNKIQNIVVSVYKKSDGNDASPRATVTFPLSSKETNMFVYNGDKSKGKISLKYEQKSGEDKQSIHAYLGNTEVPFASQDNIAGNLSTNGWTKLPNGLIMVWGKGHFREGYTDVDTLISVNFPIVFPHKCLNISITTSYETISGNGLSSTLYPCKIDNNGFYVNTDTLVQTPSEYYYFAIGY